MRKLLIIFLISISGLSYADSFYNKCKLSANEICITSKGLNIEKIKDSFDKKKYIQKFKKREFYLQKKSTDIANYEKNPTKSSAIINRNWNKIVKEKIKKDDLDNNLLYKILSPEGYSYFDYNYLRSLFRYNVFNLNIDIGKQKKPIDIVFHKEYISKIWNIIKPPTIDYKNKKIINKDQVSFAMFFGSSQSIVIPENEKTFEYEVNYIKDKFPYENKNDLLYMLNSEFEKIPNAILKNAYENKKEGKSYRNIINKINSITSSRNNKIYRFKQWQMKTIKSLHSTFHRKIIIVDKFRTINQSPRVDNAIGNLYISKKHYIILEKKGLLNYLMLHESSHIVDNLKINRKIINNLLESEIPNLLEKICVIEKCDKYSEIMNGKFNYSDFFERTASTNELLIDLSVISSLKKKSDRDKYLDMLRILLPKSHRDRYSIINNFSRLVNDIAKLKLSRKQVLNSLLFYRSNKPPTNYIDFFHDEIKYFMHNNKTKDKNIHTLLNKTFKLNKFYSDYKNYNRINKILNKYDIDSMIKEYISIH